MMKSKSKKKNPSKRPAPRGPRRAEMMMLGAPAGVSQDLQQFTRFLPGSSPEGIIIHACVPVSQVLRETTAAQGTGLFPGTSGNAAISGQLNLTSPAWLAGAGTKFNDGFTSPIFDLIASAFVRYRVKKLVFHYEPQASATTSERLVFAYAQDPLHPVLWNATVPTQAGLLSLADSIAFAPWRAWSMDVTKKLDNTLYYTFSEASTTVGEHDERFSDFGIMSLMTSSVGAAQNSPCGVLYAELMVELVEFCPISVTRPAAFRHLLPRLSLALQGAGGGSSVPKIQEPTDKETERKDLIARLNKLTA